jgi:ElaB/YqjD/DUF883 family membrane-anchored ribosome-binding protein
MDMARFLKRSANLLVGITLIKLIGEDLRAEIRQDAQAARVRTAALVRRSPYRAAGTAAALGVFAGMWMSHRSHRRGYS